GLVLALEVAGVFCRVDGLRQRAAALGAQRTAGDRTDHGADRAGSRTDGRARDRARNCARTFTDAVILLDSHVALLGCFRWGSRLLPTGPSCTRRCRQAM